MALSFVFESKRFGELYHLTRGKTQVLGTRARVDINLHFGQLSSGRRVKRAPIDDAEARKLPFIAKIDVLANRQVGEQRLLLEDHTDTVAVGICCFGET